MIWLILALVMIAGAANAAQDKLQFHFANSIFYPLNPRRFWDPTKSWENKYKNGDPRQGPKFPGATTVLSFVFDGWHLFQFVELSCMQMAVALAVYWTGKHVILGNLLDLFIIFAGLKMAYSATFEFFFSVVLKRKFK